ncbi:MAG: NERD domain-containing protein [Gracilimonas sp.]|uniref:nuclease-related domain-containing protein n=1 Tax=Gracilimonas sp. TaxID=1974203 RepID=UPI003750A8F7|nr:NERD domain-containing protein [Gracilimonas sp.]
MAVVVGKIQTLKKLRESLDEKGIHRFNSINDINTFLKNYEHEKDSIPINEKNKLDKELQVLEESIKQARERSVKNALLKIYYGIKISWFSYKKKSLKNDYENILSKRSKKSTQELANIKETVESLYTLISGAIGENSVVNELQKLPDSFYVINDFSLAFNPPIYNRKEDDRIASIQIDHLLISQSGIFVIETKNWSSESIQNLDLRSPIEQIKRTSYALFVKINSESNLSLAKHHWGSKKVPIRNIIVMTNSVPKEEFKYVKVLPLDNLNGYVKYFESVFSDSEVESIFHHLNSELD